MKNPPAFGDPDRMTSPNYTIDQGEGDAGGVHTNSGVNNKAAYLITDGTAASPAASTAARSPASASTRRRASTTRSRPRSSPRAATTPTSAPRWPGVRQPRRHGRHHRGRLHAGPRAPSRPPRWPPTRRPPPRPRRRAASRRQPGAPEPLLRRHGEPRGDATGSRTTSASGTSTTDLRPQRRLQPARRGRSGRGRHPLARAGPERRVAGRRDVVPALRPRVRVRGLQHAPTSSTAACSSSAPTAARTWADISAPAGRRRLQRHASTAPRQPALRPSRRSSSESNGYRATRATLSSLAGQSVRFRFTHRHRPARGSGRGWFIDDVRIYSCLPRTPTATASRTARDACPTAPGTAERLPAGRRVAAAAHDPAAGWRHVGGGGTAAQGHAQEREAAVLQDQRQGQEAAREVHAQQLRRRPPRDDQHQVTRKSRVLPKLAQADQGARLLAIKPKR